MCIFPTMASNIYTAYYSWTLAAGAPNSSTIRILQPSREILVKSVLLSWKAVDIATNLQLPMATQNSQILTFQIGLNTATKAARAFNLVAGAAPNNTGEAVIIQEAGQYYFDAFYFMNEVQFYLYIVNRSAGQVRNDISITVETIEKIKF